MPASHYPIRRPDCATMLSARPMWMGSRPGIGCRGVIGRPSGGRRAILNMFNIPWCRRPIGSRTCTMQLRVVINKTSSLCQPGSCTTLYDPLVPTDANVRIARPSANVNGVPTRRRMVSSWFASDYLWGQPGHQIGKCEAGITQVFLQFENYSELFRAHISSIIFLQWSFPTFFHSEGGGKIYKLVTVGFGFLYFIDYISYD